MRIIKYLIIVLICLGGLTLEAGAGQKKEGETALKGPIIKGIQGYTRYENAKYHFAFKYPKNWILSEREGRKSFIYSIHILGPRDKENTCRTSLSVRVYPTKEIKGRWDGVNELMTWYTDTRAIWGNNRKTTFSREATLAKLEARESELTYNLMSKLYGKSPSNPLSKMRIVIAQKGPYLYVIEYQGLRDDYEKYFKAYKRAKKTFKFFQPAEVAPGPQEIVIVPNETVKSVGLAKPLSFAFNEIPLRPVLQFFADKSGVRIILNGKPEGIVNLRGEDITVKEALDRLAKEQNFKYKIKKDAIYIKKR
jgi:hypothetical protein